MRARGRALMEPGAGLTDTQAVGGSGQFHDSNLYGGGTLPPGFEHLESLRFAALLRRFVGEASIAVGGFFSGSDREKCCFGANSAGYEAVDKVHTCGETSEGLRPSIGPWNGNSGCQCLRFRLERQADPVYV